jgi:hypothetical protein
MAAANESDSQKLFAEAFRKYGQPTSLSPGIDPVSISYPYIVQNFFPGIYCDYVDTDELNAVASIYKGRELVAIFSGLINFFYKYFAAFLSDPNMFTTIGDPCKDLNATEANAARLRFIKQHPKSGFAPLSCCSIRSEAILEVIYCCTLFLHAHEVAHIVLGHLDLLKDEHGINVHEELPIVPLSLEEGDLRKAFELQADQSAALTSLHLFRQRIDAQPQDKRVANADLLWAIAVDAIFVLFELAAISKGCSRSLTHPDPFIRWTSVRVCVGERAEEHGIRRLQIPAMESPPIAQIIKWMEFNGFVDQCPLFPFNDVDKAARKLYSTWDGLAPYMKRLEKYRDFRGNRGVHHV